jgi:hypothetical protein
MKSKPLSHQGTTPLFSTILDRSATDIPDYYKPSASAVSICGSAAMRTLGGLPIGNGVASGWRRRATGFCKISRTHGRTLWVQRRGRFWIIERTSTSGLDQDEALVCAFSGNLIWAQTKTVAMLLAEHCDPLPTSVLAAHWEPVHP